MNIFFLNSQPKHTSVLGTKKNLLRLSSFQHPKHMFKAAYSVTMNIFRNFFFLFKSFVKVELSYVFTIKMFSTALNCMEK